jgi:hypothetical protein
MSFLEADLPSEKDVIRFTWRSEALYLLLWASKRVSELPLPRKESATKQIVSQLLSVNESPWTFIDRGLGQESPSSLKRGVVQEWHHAVNWLTMYGDQDWDDVQTDT